MKIYIDLSVLTKDSAVGRVSGMLELAAVPTIGSSVVLAHPTNGVQPISVPDFSGIIRVTDLRFEPISSSVAHVAISLEDVIAASVEDGLKIMAFLESGFGLSSEEYEFDE